jgi:long-chain acyl-CoA synthetase
MRNDTIPARVQAQARTRPHAPAFWVRGPQEWEKTTWEEYAFQVREAGRALMALGLEPDGRTCILGFNRPEWTVFDLATMTVGAAPAGIYTTSSSEEAAYIVAHTEAAIVLVEDLDQWAKIRDRRDELSALRHVVLMDGVPRPEGEDGFVLTWQEFLAGATAVPEERLERRLDALRPEDLATLIYTSGTTGPPKGVMLTHDNLAWTAEAAIGSVKASPDDSTLSYLPLSHIAEQLFSIHLPATLGSSIYFARSLDGLLEDLQEVQPTMFLGVPRIWEKFQAGIMAKGSKTTGVKKRIAVWAKGVGSRYHELLDAGRKPGRRLTLKHRLASKLVFDKVKPALGLDRAWICITSAAPISPEVLRFMASLDIPVREVYGQSEVTGPTTINVPGRTRLGTVGPAMQGVDVKIAEDGEILVRGRNVFAGYYRDAVATAETLQRGWLHSGDLGHVDREGFLHVTGRKKDIIITAGGKNVAPKNWETDVKQLDLVGEAVMIGDRRKYLSALISLDPERSVIWAQEQGADPKALHTNAVLRAEIQRVVDEANRRYARVEQVKRFEILPRPLAVESGELTPTLKVKRNVVNDHFAEIVERMYAG